MIRLFITKFIFRICTKYIDKAMARLKNKKVEDEKELSLVERILANEPDIKTAYILALDLILVGIDTVRLLKHLAQPFV